MKKLEHDNCEIFVKSTDERLAEIEEDLDAYAFLGVNIEFKRTKCLMLISRGVPHDGGPEDLLEDLIGEEILRPAEDEYWLNS